MPTQTWTEFRNNKISRQMSMTLRHEVEKRGLKMNQKGFIKVKDLLDLQIFRTLNTTMQDIHYAVQHNDKKRFALKEDVNKQ